MNKKNIFVIVAAAMYSLGCAMPQTSMAQECVGAKPEFKLKVKRNTIQITPDNKPLSISPDEFADRQATFQIKVIDNGGGGFTVEPGDVVVTQVFTKTVGNVPEICTTELHFTEAEFTNELDANCVEVTIESQDDEVPDDEQICFDVMVKNVGTIDPRAQVTDEDSRRDLLPAMQSRIEEIDELRMDDDQKSTFRPLFDAYFIERFGLTEAEARRYADEYAEY